MTPLFLEIWAKGCQSDHASDQTKDSIVKSFLLLNLRMDSCDGPTPPRLAYQHLLHRYWMLIPEKVSLIPLSPKSKWVAHEPTENVQPIFDGMVFTISVAADKSAASTSRRKRQASSKAQSVLAQPSMNGHTLSLDKDRLTAWIQQRGGTILATFMDCLEYCGLQKSPTTASQTLFQKAFATTGVLDLDRAKTLYLISDTPSTTPKYLLALSLGLPRISGIWISECLMNNRLEDHRPFFLSNGWSEEMGAMSVCPHNRKFMSNVTIIVYGSGQFKQNWEVILTSAGARLISLPTGTKVKHVHKSFLCDFVLTERKPAKTLIERVEMCCKRVEVESQPQWETQPTVAINAESAKMPWFVSHHWAKQCLINQRLVRHNGHPLYSSYTC